MAKTSATLTEISPDVIQPNPDNPRLIFHEREMIELLDSISQVGIKVPLTVFPDNGGYFLIDGERRWRCARKLNLREIPVIVQPKPSKLENLLMMFNIHNVRVDWDLMPMALKLDEIREMLEQEGQSARARDLAGITGVALPTVRRALELLELPKKYRRMLLREANKPRDKQEITVDLFIEINKSKRVVERYTPEVFEEVKKSQYVDTMIRKYRSGVINNVVKFRDVSKIARSEKAGGSRAEAIPILIKLVKEPLYTVEEAYKDTVERDYELRDVTSRVASLTDRLKDFKIGRGISNKLRSELKQLRKQIDRILGSNR